MGTQNRHVIVKAAAWIILVLLIAPVFVVVPFSLTPTQYLTLPHGHLSLRWYVNFFTSPDWQSSIWQSLYIAIGSMTLSVVLGTLCGVGLWRISSRYTEMVRNLTLLPLIAPPVVSGMAFFYGFAKLGLLDTSIGLILGHTILAVPYVIISVSTALANFEPRLEQAARNLGASIAQTIIRVIVPGIMPGIGAGAIFAFLTSWDEVVVALFVTSFNVVTLPRRMWETMHFETDATTAACATTLVILTMIGVGIYISLLRPERQRSTRALKPSEP